MKSQSEVFVQNIGPTSDRQQTHPGRTVLLSVYFLRVVSGEFQCRLVAVGTSGYRRHFDRCHLD